MAYCAFGDVQKLFVNISFTGTTPVTEADITDVHIPQADAFIDGRLRRYYATPVTHSGDLGLMRLVSMNLTAAQPNDQANARRHREWGERLLQQVIDGELTLRAERLAVADAGKVTEPLVLVTSEY